MTPFISNAGYNPQQASYKDVLAAIKAKQAAMQGSQLPFPTTAAPTAPNTGVQMLGGNPVSSITLPHYIEPTSNLGSLGGSIGTPSTTAPTATYDQLSALGGSIGTPSTVTPTTYGSNLGSLGGSIGTPSNVTPAALNNLGSLGGSIGTASGTNPGTYMPSSNLSSLGGSIGTPSGRQMPSFGAQAGTGLGSLGGSIGTPSRATSTFNPMSVLNKTGNYSSQQRPTTANTGTTTGASSAFNPSNLLSRLRSARSGIGTQTGATSPGRSYGNRW